MAEQQSSRLNRLLTLLDTGSTQATRFTAARQIGDIAKSQQDLNPLLKKVSHYIHSKNWDTRVAAAHAIGAIVQNVKHPSLTEIFASIESKMSDAGLSVSAEDVVAWTNSPFKIMSNITFRSFDIEKVLELGGVMLASGGQEYDIAGDSSKNPRERLARQKQNLRQRLGLDVCEQFMDVNDMIKDEDLIVHKLQAEGDMMQNRSFLPSSAHSFKQLVARMVPSVQSRRPSARELNLLKRKAKINSKDQAKGWGEEGDAEASNANNVTTPKGSGSDSFRSTKVDADEESYEHDVDGTWPFLSFVEQLILDMFDPVWEVRHGSVMALREVLTYHGGSAGVFIPDSGSDGSLYVEDDPTPMKREREIDLNIQVSADISESNPKRLKVQNVSSPTVDIGSCTNGDNLGSCVKVEDGEYNLLTGQYNDNHGVSSVKMEPAIDLEGISTQPKEAIEYVGSNDYFRNPEILKGLPSEMMALAKVARHSCAKNSEFLQDCAIRFLCVLSLDRFGDYVSDQVIAPVRETCAQALGAVFKYMHPSLVHETLSILLKMQRRPEWEIRHGSLLGIKYLVAVRQEMLRDLLGCVLPACKAGLEDPDDDVRAVAADALIPTAGAIVSLRGQTLHSIVMILWDILLDLDDLSPSTSSVMNLLAEIYSQEDMIPKVSGELTSKQEFDLNEAVHVDDFGEGRTLHENPYMLSTLAPRLWPFVRHSITSVRFSAIRTLERLLEAGRKRNISESLDVSFWPSFILGDTLRIVFQNLLLESNEDILHCTEKVWRLLVQCPPEDLESAARLYLSSWVELASTPYGSPLDASKMFWPVPPPRTSHFRAAAKMRAVMLENDGKDVGLSPFKVTIPQERVGDVSAHPVKIVVGADVEMSVTSTRVVTASALGVFASKLREDFIQYIIDPLQHALASLSGVKRQVAAMVLVSWFKELNGADSSGPHKSVPSFVNHVKAVLLDLLACSDPAFPTKDTIFPYAELSRTYTKLRNEASQFLRAVESSGMSDIDFSGIDLENLTADSAINFVSTCSNTAGAESCDRNIADDIESLKQRVLATSGYLKCVQNNLHITVTALVASAVVWMGELPARLNPIILPLMASIKREQEEILQQKAADALAELIFCCTSRKPSPNDKLIKNICSLVCLDPYETPQAGAVSSMESIDDEYFLSRGNSSVKHKSRVNVLAGGEDRSKIEGFISRRGSELALKHLCQKFGALLFNKLPKLWDCLTEILIPSHADKKQIVHAVESANHSQMLINNIQLVRSVTPLLDEALQLKLLTLLPCIFKCIRHNDIAVRLAASRCITSMAKSSTTNVMAAVIESVIPLLGDVTSVHARQGAGLLISLLVHCLGVELVPYAPLLVVPLLKCMSDCDSSVRQSVTRSFAALVPLLPLARGLPLPAGLTEDRSRNADDAKFLEQLLDSSHIDDYKLLTDLRVTLRRYQQEGINWLGFLKRFKLHGILCDDMGLGKTLQASAILASDIAENRALKNSGSIQLSLIVCPSTLVGHWAFEIEKFIDPSLVCTLQYTGSVQERLSLRENFDKYNVIITSYDVIRKDIEYLGQIHWNYCILDEGHVIKNSKSKITVGVKQLKSAHRLILSGTPIQNNIMDLWSLFDFLMPGFLGTERQFHATYGKPLVAARDPKCSAKDAEAGALAMEALHKQVMPFLLRRTKDEVLSDLPEKIIQDRYCDLSPVQFKLYEKFSGSHVRQEISSMVKIDESAAVDEKPSSPKASSHVFQAIQYLLKLCSHPLLVFGEKLPDSLKSQLMELFPASSDISSELHKLHHSPKLVALQEILQECGIGVDASGSEGSVGVGQHRVLIFAQHKALLDIIERDLFHTHMQNVTYLRLDGSVETEKRFDIVKTFNSDPTIDALLLTTHVGGLGLNLTSADTLVFMEHDWNPQRDHQAMDRAHRLGQRKVVNVHRLIMRGTIEEKVMSLQKFKVSIANAIITTDNASLKTMNTDQLLDLFASAETSRKGGAVSKRPDKSIEGVGGGKGLKAILGGLEDLWDESQYTEEYNLDHFLAKLNG